MDIRHDGSECHAEVRGPLDITTADQLARRLLAASRGGTLPPDVDLKDVTLLASAAVRALFQLCDQHTANHQPLGLRAPPGSPARAVIDLTRLPAAGASATISSE